jgi:type IX secretion system PorP/SprF family membrane protein
MKARMLFLVLLAGSVQAQDLHFSQFTEQPSLLNPGLTGATAPSRASMAYREQWRSIASSYKTMGASYETRFRTDSWEQVDNYKTMTFKQRSLSRLAAGLSVYKDNAGDGSISRTQLNASIATFVPTGRLSFVSLGIQASLEQQRLDQSKLLFPDQYNGSFYDPDQASEENFQKASSTFADFASGVAWSYGQTSRDVFANKQLKATAGIAVYHFNKSRQSFLVSDNNAHYFKYVLHGDLLVSLRDPDYALAPSLLWQLRGSSSELTGGMMLKRYMKIDSKYTGLVKRSSIGIGGYVRNRDAAIVSLQLQWKDQLAISMSYDFNVSRLRQGSHARGGTELVLRYTPPRAFLYQKKKGTVDKT